MGSRLQILSDDKRADLKGGRRKVNFQLTGGESEEDNDGSESKEKSGGEVERESSVGVAVGVMAGVGVVVVLLRVPTTTTATSTGSLISQGGLVDLTFGPDAGEKEECEGKSKDDLTHHVE